MTAIEKIDELLRLTGAGNAAVLRIIGGGGAGKTTILRYAAGHATGFRVVRAHAAAGESDLPYAGLHLLCAPLLDEIHELPADHRQALVATLQGERPDPLLLGLATLGLVVRAAAARPLCLVVDDAHHLDRSSARILAFVARRLDRHAVLLLIADQDPPRLGDLDGLPEMRLEPLPAAEARALLDASTPGRIDDLVAGRILAEARGNPRALAEAFAGVTAAELAGGFAIPRHGVPCGDSHDCLDRVRRLPADARRLLLAAAADPTGDAAALWRAAARLAIGPDAADRLDKQNLLVLGDPIVFACPALRPAVYFEAGPGERREVHRALAEATRADPVRCAWHRAEAATGFDDALAAELDRCAAQAQSRGGASARAAFLAKATLLTGDPAGRADRALNAAAACHDAGAPEAGQRLLAVSANGPHCPVRAARITRHRARSGTARQLFDAARRLEPYDAAEARDAYLESLLAAMSADDGSAAEIARSAPAAPGTHPVDRMLHGLAVRALDGYRASVAPLTSAITSLCDGGELDARSARRLGTAARIAVDLWDSRSWATLAHLSGADASAEIGPEPAAAELNGLARYDEAIDAARAVTGPDQLAVTGRALLELVEAATRSGRAGVAAEAAARLFDRTGAVTTDWARGAEALARGLLADGEEAESHYREAVARLARTGLRGPLARARLLYGEWLRRRHRRIDARAELQAARDLFAATGAGAFAERAGRELLAAGEPAHQRQAAGGRLTAQEGRVAYLARDGLSNPEIAARLFVSARTVEYHLHKVFAKLGVTSRTELHLVLDPPPSPTGPIRGTPRAAAARPR